MSDPRREIHRHHALIESVLENLRHGVQEEAVINNVLNNPEVIYDLEVEESLLTRAQQVEFIKRIIRRAKAGDYDSLNPHSLRANHETSSPTGARRLSFGSPARTPNQVDDGPRRQLSFEGTPSPHARGGRRKKHRKRTSKKSRRGRKRRRRRTRKRV